MSTARVLVTGAAGFVAGHMLRHLEAALPEAELFGLVRRAPGEAFGTRVAPLEADIEQPAAVTFALERAHPTHIVHLAAQSSPQLSWAEPAATLQTNVLGLLHVLEGVRALRLRPRILVVGSAEEYGLVDPRDIPLTEEVPLRPVSPYAVSKVAQSFLALQYALSHGLHVVRTRTFNHTGPGRGEGFAESSFARQLAEIEAGMRQPVLEVGNLEAVRDFTDVRDIVRAYALLLDSGEAGGVYNVCSGHGLAIRDVLAKLVEISGLDVAVRVDSERMRPADVPTLVGDATRLRQATGWAPEIPIEATLRDLWQHWRGAVAATALHQGQR